MPKRENKHQTVNNNLMLLEGEEKITLISAKKPAFKKSPEELASKLIKCNCGFALAYANYVIRKFDDSVSDSNSILNFEKAFFIFKQVLEKYPDPKNQYFIEATTGLRAIAELCLTNKLDDLAFGEREGQIERGVILLLSLMHRGDVDAADKICDFFKNEIIRNPEPKNPKFKRAANNLKDIADRCLNYKFDIDKKEQHDEGINIFEYLINKGDLSSYLRLSHLLWFGTDYLDKNIERSIALTIAAATKGYKPAFEKLKWMGECFLFGTSGVNKDREMALKMFAEAKGGDLLPTLNKSIGNNLLLPQFKSSVSTSSLQTQQSDQKASVEKSMLLPQLDSGSVTYEATGCASLSGPD